MPTGNDYIITTSMLFGGNVLANIENILNSNPQLTTITYQDKNKFYMYKGTPCQVELPSKLTIILANMPNYSTSTNEQRARSIITELSSWKPGVATINGTMKHITSHSDLVTYVKVNTGNTIKPIPTPTN